MLRPKKSITLKCFNTKDAILFVGEMKIKTPFVATKKRFIFQTLRNFPSQFSFQHFLSHFLSNLYHKK